MLLIRGCAFRFHLWIFAPILKEFMHSHRYFRMPESLLSEVPMMPLPTTGWRNSSDICLQERRPEECGAAAKSQC